MRSTYSTKPGDTINKVVEKFDASIKEFNHNNEYDDLMFIGNQVVLVPLPHFTSIKLFQYKTDTNDTLTKICDKFDITIYQVKYFNNIYNLILSENQKVNINSNNVSQGILVEFENI